MQRSQCDHNNLILWPIANPYINDQLKSIQCLFPKNVNFTLNTLLLGALHMFCQKIIFKGVREFLVCPIVYLGDNRYFRIENRYLFFSKTRYFVFNLSTVID